MARAITRSSEAVVNGHGYATCSIAANPGLLRYASISRRPVFPVVRADRSRRYGDTRTRPECT